MLQLFKDTHSVLILSLTPVFFSGMPDVCFKEGQYWSEILTAIVFKSVGSPCSMKKHPHLVLRDTESIHSSTAHDRSPQAQHVSTLHIYMWSDVFEHRKDVSSPFIVSAVLSFSCRWSMISKITTDPQKVTHVTCLNIFLSGGGFSFSLFSLQFRGVGFIICVDRGN